MNIKKTKWEDTVLSVNQIGAVMQPCVSPTAQGLILAEKQAKITWKEAYQAGAQAVFDEIKQYLPAHIFMCGGTHSIHCPRCKIEAVKEKFGGK